MSLAFLAATTAGSEASVLFTGLPLPWAVLAILVVGAANFWAYRRWAPDLAQWQRAALMALRLLATALFFLLLAKPIISLSHEVPVRGALIVLLDKTLSMTIPDARISPQDLVRAGIATGALDPKKGLDQPAPAAGDLKKITRAELLEALRVNKKLNLWSRLAEKADLIVYDFSSEAGALGGYRKDSSAGGDPAEAVKLKDFTGKTTALGDSLRGALNANRGRSLAGVLLVTDGANNAGVPPVEAALAAHADGVPLFAYGVGVTQPHDVVISSLEGPRIGFVNDRVEYKASLEAGNLAGRNVTVTLSAGGEPVDKKTVAVTGPGPMEVSLGYTPAKAGEVEVVATAAPLEDEVNKDNNSASATLRVLGEKIHVLYIEQSPRWDFRYLLATLQRDRRLQVKAYLFDGDPGLDKLPDSPFLAELPSTKEGLYANQIIILGDVDPKRLGEERMDLLQKWVGDHSGGLIFLAGPAYDPFAYANTPLEALLPVELGAVKDPAKFKTRYPNLRPLRMTDAGLHSRYFRADPDADQNRRIWNSFPGVRWTAAVGPAKPGTEVISVDPDPSKATSSGPAPVIAMQNFGAGQTIYFGTDETYRWRSLVGEKYYITIWGQIIQSLALHRLTGASQLVQLRADQPRYFVGDQVTISGQIYQKNFEPLATASVPGKLVAGSKEAGQGGGEARDLSLAAVPGKRGEYEARFKAEKAGVYQFSCVQDPKAVVEFEVVDPQAELLETAMNAELLESMAKSSNGKFLREEDLDSLPDLLQARSKTIPQFDQIKLYESPWWLVALVGLLCLEWMFRRMWQLK